MFYLHLRICHNLSVKTDKSTKSQQCNIPPVMTKCQLCSHADFCQLMIVQTFQLVLAVVDAIKRRREHNEQRKDNAEDEIVAGLWQFFNLLHDCPANIEHRQIHFVHCIWLPYHTAHYITEQPEFRRIDRWYNFSGVKVFSGSIGTQLG